MSRRTSVRVKVSVMLWRLSEGSDGVAPSTDKRLGIWLPRHATHVGYKSIPRQNKVAASR
jgi:hypothetical protein